MDNMIYTATDIAGILGVSSSKAYKIIQQLNGELRSQGYITVCGKVPRKYFEERTYLQ